MAPKYRLTYFDGRGYAEHTRLLFAYLKLDYEDVRLEHMGEEWKKIKPKQPFCKAPVLEVDGVVIAEARAISRYIAREHGLAGNNNLEAALCDMIVSASRDYMAKRWEWAFETDPEKKEKCKANLIEIDLPVYLNGLTKIIKNSHYFVGNSLTWADVGVANFLMDVRNDFPDLFNKYKALNDHIDRIHNLPGIKEWVETRPKTPW